MKTSTRRWGVGGGIVLIALAVGQANGTLSTVPGFVEGLMSRFVLSDQPPARGRLVQSDVRTRPKLKALAQRLDAKIVWSSNRDGNHELHLLDLRQLRIERLTHHPNVDFFSRFSPDGEQIVFSRSQREWVSFRDVDAWDVYVINTDGSEERLLARQGYHPQWTAAGDAVVFFRDQKVVHHELATGEESVLFEAGENFRRIRFGDIALSGAGTRLATPVVGSKTLVATLDGDVLATLPGNGTCQPSWAPGDEYLVWIESEGNGGTRVMRSGDGPEDATVMIDLPGPYSHEYFPKLSNDGRWLVWGATANGHEHDRAPYEIFVWELGTPWETTVRVTQYTGNDQWPDIYVGGPERGP